MTSVYCVFNKTTQLFFEDKKDADYYMRQYSASMGLKLAEVPVIPKGSTKEEDDCDTNIREGTRRRLH